MKITLFSANQSRHNYLINLLSKNCDKLFVVQENTYFNPVHYSTSKIMENYFNNVTNAQTKLFGNSFDNKKKNVKLLSLKAGNLSKCSTEFLSDFLKSDIYIVFGSSYIKGDLLKFLIKNKAINIHMGISPYYRGTDCNFWALYDDNPHLVGATIHMLSKGLDSGPILYHALSNLKTNPFEYTMSTVKSAFYSLVERIKNESIFNIKPEPQDKKKEIRYSKKDEFTEEVVKKFLNKKINIFSKDFKKELLKSPFFFDS